MKSKLLTAVERASRRRVTADLEYRATIHAARAGGHTMPEIGKAAGITRQGVLRLLHPERRGKT